MPPKKNTLNGTPVSKSRLEDSQVFNLMNSLSRVNIEGESRFLHTHNSSISNPTDVVEFREDESTYSEELVPEAEVKNDAYIGQQALNEMELLQGIRYDCSGTNLDTFVASPCGTGVGMQTMQPHSNNTPESWDAIPYEDVSLFHRSDFEMPRNKQTLSENNTAVCESFSRWVSPVTRPQLNPIVMSSGERGILQCTPCNCKMSMCLKLYCECFSAGLYCIDSCSCVNCFNKPIHDNLVLATRELIVSDAKFEDPYAGFEFQATNLCNTCALEGELKWYEGFPCSCVGVQTMQPESNNALESWDGIPYEDVSLFHRSDFEMPGNKQTLSENNTAVYESSSRWVSPVIGPQRNPIVMSSVERMIESCKRCNCKLSKCYNLDCECFAARIYCIESCSCVYCFNKPIHTVLAPEFSDVSLFHHLDFEMLRNKQTLSKYNTAVFESSQLENPYNVDQPSHNLPVCNTSTKSKCNHGIIKKYNKLQMKAAMSRYVEKKKRRPHGKRIRYEDRKRNAQSKPRIRGRFAKAEQIHDETCDDREPRSPAHMFPEPAQRTQSPNPNQTDPTRHCNWVI